MSEGQAPGHDRRSQDGPRPAEAKAEPRQPPEPHEPHEPRPIIERLGLAAVALVLAILFGGIAAASWVGGEPFLTVMGAIGCLMTLWVGALTLVRG